MKWDSTDLSSLRQKQHWDGRLYAVSDVVNVLAVRMGMPKSLYPKTYIRRALIALLRRKESAKVTGKGYGPDWSHEGIGVKYSILSYTSSGRLPPAALQQASELILVAEAEALKMLMAQRMDTPLAAD